MIIKAKAYQTIEKSQGFGETIESGIKEAIAYFQDQLKGIYFRLAPKDTPVYRSDVKFERIKPKLVELTTYIKRKPIIEGVCPLLSVTLVTGKVLDNGDIQWMIPITNGPVDDDEIFATEEILAAKIDELESDPLTSTSDDLMFLSGFYDAHFRFSGLVRQALNNLNQPLLVLDIDKSGKYEIKLTQ